jgi:uncharacterized protein involved in exopolysaccharide biosynthesis
MSDNEIDSSQSYVNDEIDLLELFNILWVNKLFLATLTGLFALASIIYSLSLTNIYTAETTLAPSASRDSSNLSQYAGLSSMTGISLPGSASVMSDKDLALSLIKSKGFLQRLIDKYNILPDLVAAKDWDLTSNSIIYDPDLYDATKKVWVRKVKPPRRSIPSTQEAYKFFEKAISLSVDNKSGVITLRLLIIGLY